MTTSNLKIIACLTMLIDHIGAILYPDQMIFRIIGRIAFPIFAFLIVEGYYYTKDLKKYLMRLGLFALVSEIPFDLAVNSAKVIEFQHQNVFFTLFIALLAISIYDLIKEKYPIFASIALVGFAVLNEVIQADYGLIGILIIFGFYKCRSNKYGLFFWLLSINLLLGALYTLNSGILSIRTMIQVFELFALIFIFNYNGKKGLSLRYVFYVFYPGHLLLLYLINNA